QQLTLGTRNSVALWDRRSNEPSLELFPVASSEGPFSRSMTVAYSPCGQFLASSTEDHIVHLWHRHSIRGNIESWSCVVTLRVFSEPVVSLSWNPVIPTEFITASMDGSVRVWRISRNDRAVVVKMLWGTNLRRLCCAGVVLKGATGLRPIYRKLLAQRRAFDRGLSLDDNGSDDGSQDDDGFEYGFYDGFYDGSNDYDGFDDWLEEGDGFDDGSDDGSDDESEDEE
ncbi:hypothetical protein EC957_007401, partial [Mortierella hygrophila]